VPAAVKRLLAVAATAVGVAVTLRIAFHTWHLNYDARYALLWARDASRGLTPDFEAPFAPTPHPLSTAWSALALPFGQDGDAIIVWGTLLAFGVLVYLAYRLGAELFSPWAGVAAAVVVLTRPAMLRDALLGYQDVVFAVLVVTAVLLEVRRPRRGAAVLAVLAAAGLLRPEAWVLSGLYWLYLRPSERLRLVPLVAAAPVLWALMDLVVTGDALHSLHGTSELAETVDRRRDVEDAPYWTAKFFGFTLREPLVVGIPIGLAVAWRFRARVGRPALLALAVAGALTAVFMAGPLFGLPLVDRYVRTPSVLLAAFFGLALTGWRLADGRERRVWQGLAVLAALVFVAFVPDTIDRIRDLRHRLQRDNEIYADLRAVGRSPAVRALAERCGPLVAVDHRPIAHLRYWLDGDPGSVATSEGTGNRDPALLLVPRRTGRMRVFLRGELPEVPRSPGAHRVYTNSSWGVLSTSTSCRSPASR
jgi:hypothetical protein